MFKLIRYHFPPIVKHVLAPQDDFGMQKKNMLNRQKKWDWVRPPPLVWEKFPRFIVFFLESLPKSDEPDKPALSEYVVASFPSK